jgi:large subunit ribosomal protein L21
MTCCLINFHLKFVPLYNPSGVRFKLGISLYRHDDTGMLEYIMYAVIQSGGKQHRVVEGETLKVELLKAETGSTITFDDVLMVVNGDSIQIGAPVVAGAKVTAEVVGHGRHDKIRIIKMRRRKHYRKQQGHRQWFTELKITGIAG